MDQPRRPRENGMALFRNKYRTESARLAGWDYSSPGYYFITICTHDRGHLFGSIIDSVMVCSDYGKIVEDEWRIMGQKNAHIHLDEFGVMPNHMHGIIHILRRAVGTTRTSNADIANIDVSRGNGIRCRRDVARNVSTGAMNATFNEMMSAISPITGSLPVLVRSFKSAITKRINVLRNTPGAQVLQYRFHDHIIRDQNELFRISQYIRNNPANWQKDKFRNDDQNAVHEDGAEYEQEIWMV
jgi:hypothetical protein